MRRVSSRQRLVSWDAFDASTMNENHDDDYDDHHDSDNGDNVDDGSPDYKTCYGDDESNISRDNPSFASLSSKISFDNNYYDDTEALLSSSNSNHDSGSSNRKRDRSTRSKPKDIKQCLSSSLNKIKTNNFGVNTLQTPQQPRNTIGIVPAFPHEINANTKNNTNFSSLLQDLICMDDVKLHILSFVHVSDARAMLSTCKQYYHLLKISEEAHSLWMEYYSQLWPSTTCASTIDIQDDLELPITTSALATRSINASTTTYNSANLSVLMGMASKTQPTDIDESQFVPSSNSVDLLLRIAAARRGEANMRFTTAFIATSDEKEKEKVVQYTGPVGPGDRCIISNQPFPKPKLMKPFRKYSFDSSSSQSEGGRSSTLSISNGGVGEMMMPYVNVHSKNHHHPFSNLLCRNNSACSSSSGEELKVTSKNAIWRPFVVPYVTNCSAESGHKEVNLTPRLVAYYEVTIHPTSKLSSSEQDREQQNNHHRHDNERHPMRMNLTHRRGDDTRTDCVAVGISSNGFHLHSKMPGWDTLSYGYHGDDGGIYHGSGTMEKQYGPRFGCGDTVGCGVDYVTGGLFFTLNGAFLGYGWSNIDPDYLQKNDLYPTIGVDTKCPLSVNFGNEKPFQFDLTKFIKRQKDIVECCLSPLLNGCYNNKSSNNCNINDHNDGMKKHISRCKLSPSSLIKSKRKNKTNEGTSSTTTRKTSWLSPPRIRRPRRMNRQNRTELIPPPRLRQPNTMPIAENRARSA